MRTRIIALGLMLVSFHASTVLAAPPTKVTTSTDLSVEVETITSQAAQIDRDIADEKRMEEERRKQEAADRLEVIKELSIEVATLPALATNASTAAFHISIEEMNETTRDWKISLPDIGTSTQALNVLNKTHESIENKWIIDHKDFPPCQQAFWKYQGEKARREAAALKRSLDEERKNHPPLPPPNPKDVKTGQHVLDELYSDKAKPKHAHSKPRH